MFRKKPQDDTTEPPEQSSGVYGDAEHPPIRFEPSEDEVRERFEAIYGKDPDDPTNVENAPLSPDDKPWKQPEHYRAIDPMRGNQLCVHLYGVSSGSDDATGADTFTAVSLPLASLCAVLEAPLGKVKGSLTVLTHTQSVTIEGKNIESLCYTLSEGQVGAVRCYNHATWNDKPKPQDPIITKITLES